MLDALFEKLGKVFERAEHHTRDAYLADSVDLVDLENRMRALETEGCPDAGRNAFGPYSGVMPQDRNH